MRTLPNDLNQPLRDAIEHNEEVLDLLLASTLALTHDGTLELDEDGSLPRHEPLPLGVSHAADTPVIVAYTDLLAMAEPGAPSAGITTPTVPVAGDDLVVLAARNDVGIHLNPGSRSDLLVDAENVHELGEYLADLRSHAGQRMFGRDTLVTLRGVDAGIDQGRHDLLLRELHARGASLAYLCEYALHGPNREPEAFTRLIVVGDEDGAADHALREDARRVTSFLTGQPTDSVAYASMQHVRHVTDPILQPEGALPEPLVGVV